MIIYIIIMIFLLRFFYKYYSYESFNDLISYENISKGLYVIPKIYNHSEDPNTAISKIKLNGSYFLKSIKDIKKGDKITVKYDDFNYNILNTLKIKKSKIHGLGLHLTKDVDKDKFLFTSIKDTRITYLSRFINHSFNPSCYLLKNKNDYYLYSKYKMKTDDEITINYDDTPYYIKNASQCGIIK